MVEQSGQHDVSRPGGSHPDDSPLSFDFTSLLPAGDALIIEPPVSYIGPCYCAHLLQACARRAGQTVRVLYANMTLAELAGQRFYRAICTAMSSLIGERLFARAAYGAPPLAGDSRFEQVFRETKEVLLSRKWIALEMEFSELERLEARTGQWVQAVAAAVAGLGFKVVACTTMFEQTSASVALLNQIKRMRPDVVTIIGGSNCEGEMAEGVASLGMGVDFVFSGDGEEAFPDFLARALSGVLPSERIIHGRQCQDLDSLPTPDYTEFFQQLAGLFPSCTFKPEEFELVHETCRGCWRGRCHFCGLNGLRARFRAKSAERALSQFKELSGRYPTRKVTMTDNTMPRAYFKTVLPRLAPEGIDLEIYYEQPPDLSLREAMTLRLAGARTLQPGIEAFSSSLLRRMNKQVTAAQTIATLRYARSTGLQADWNLLYGFPGDRLFEYERTLDLLPLLRHLRPPMSIPPVRHDRYSPYVRHAQDHGVSDVRPLDQFRLIFPAWCDVEKLAYVFEARYGSDSLENYEIIEAIREELGRWRAAWFTEGQAAPVLDVRPMPRGMFALFDARGLPGTHGAQFLTHEQASLALATSGDDRPEQIDWAVANKVGVVLDGAYVPLATAHPRLLAAFEAGWTGRDHE